MKESTPTIQSYCKSHKVKLPKEPFFLTSAVIRDCRKE